ncbi:hypothetical protein BD310DRAFT_933709 [Dichomitus squalens]|uniref:Uncharacterized protein n=1 Tax=Dichomitus squalens TaxID=114155 RepID=A0A4Q9PML0_9APHY|nr:hypothetical protein BD310DRAFT_933709 [Dichomitus squalens]
MPHDTHSGHIVECYDVSGLRYAILLHPLECDGVQPYEDIRKMRRRQGAENMRAPCTAQIDCRFPMGASDTKSHIEI